MGKLSLRGCMFFSLSLLLFNACATVKVPIRVTHPAEINMSEYKQVAISRIKGKIGRDFEEVLKNRLVEHSRFEVVERRRLRQIMGELAISQSDLADPENRIKLGKLLSASAMIAGRMGGSYSEKITTFKMKCRSRDRGEYKCTRRTREGTYNTSGSIDVIDIQSGRVIKSKLLNESCKSKTSATDAAPLRIDRGTLARKCAEKNVNVFIKAISAWTETVRVPFIKDGKIPELEKGINLAEIGEMDEAIRTFAAAARAAENNPGIKLKSIAKAYWDLGLAYEYTWEFDKAIGAFKKAYSMHPEKSYIQEINNVKRLRAERKKLEQQRM